MSLTGLGARPNPLQRAVAWCVLTQAKPHWLFFWMEVLLTIYMVFWDWQCWSRRLVGHSLQIGLKSRSCHSCSCEQNWLVRDVCDFDGGGKLKCFGRTGIGSTIVQWWGSYGVTGGPMKGWLVGIVGENVILSYWDHIGMAAQGQDSCVCWWSSWPVGDKCHFQNGLLVDHWPVYEWLADLVKASSGTGMTYAKGLEKQNSASVICNLC